MSNNIVLNTSDRAIYGKLLTKAYLDYIRKLPNKTPQELVDIVYVGRKNWFDHLSPDDLDHFSKLYEKVSLEMDIDIHWNVSVKNQLAASEAFNNFITAMKKLPLDSKKSPGRVTAELNTAFSKAFGVTNKSANILKSFEKNTQLKEVGKRLVKELATMGYAF